MNLQWQEVWLPCRPSQGAPTTLVSICHLPPLLRRWPILSHQTPAHSRILAPPQTVFGNVLCVLESGHHYVHKVCFLSPNPTHSILIPFLDMHAVNSLFLSPNTLTNCYNCQMVSMVQTRRQFIFLISHTDTLPLPSTYLPLHLHTVPF